MNFQAAFSTGGENYGWRLIEGSCCFNPGSNCNDGSRALPILEYDHSLGCSISGGYRYRGLQSPGMAGLYFYGDFCSGRIWGAMPNAQGVWTAAQLLATALQIIASAKTKTESFAPPALLRARGPYFESPKRRRRTRSHPTAEGAAGVVGVLSVRPAADPDPLPIPCLVPGEDGDCHRVG